MPATDHDAGSGSDGGSQRADAGTTDGGLLMVGTPVVTAATLMMHGTHLISWQLPSSGCTSVSLARKFNATAYVDEVVKLTGSATSTSHSPSHANGTYCYRVTCTLNGMTSEPSNEKCVTQ